MATLKESWLAASPYLDQALEMSDDEREPWLATLEQRNPGLADILRTLVAEHRALASGHFLEECPPLLPGPVACAGQPIGPYRLVSLISQGGMGSVWRAERSDGRFERLAAVKFLNFALSGGGEERFKREGKILGRLCHPNIAGLLDAGVSSNGQPYLVLEYVQGEPIDQDCRRRQLSLGARIRLFVDLLGAVAYAHANLIVHRDVKPSNVLIRTDGQVKLLDFGIAKLLENEHASPPTLLTREGAGPLTPEYAAPEQLTGGAITTATDTYALGVLLYVLLTGQHPAGGESRSPADLMRAIVETEPLPPSAAVVEADGLRRVLRGDLDTIVAKALKKDPRERYASVTALADDLGRYLRFEPIAARRDTPLYRAAKFVRRNRTVVFFAALACFASLAGVVGTMTQTRTANQERAVAQRRFNEVRQLANKLFDIDEQVSQLPGSTRARQLIVDTSLEYLRRLSADVGNEPEFALELGHAYLQVARVQGVGVGRNLGQMDQAEQTLRIAEGLIAPVLAAQPANRTALRRGAQATHDRMVLAGLRHGRRDRAGRVDALALARKSAEQLDRFNAAATDQPEVIEEVLTDYMNVADEYMLGKQFDDALRICRHASELARAANHMTTLGMFHWVSAEVLQQRGDLDEALKAVRESVKLLETGNGVKDVRQTMNLAHVLIWEGRILGQESGISLGRWQDAAVPFDRAFRITDAVVHQDRNDQSSRGRLGLAGAGLAAALRRSNPRLALAVYDHTLGHLAEIRGNAVIDRMEVEALAGSSYPLRDIGRSAEARNRITSAFERLARLKLYPADKVTPGSVTGKTLRALADCESHRGNIPRAIDIYQRLLASVRAANLDPDNSLEDASDLSSIYASMASLHRRNREPGRAQALSKTRLELWRGWDRKVPNNPFVLRQIAVASTE